MVFTIKTKVYMKNQIIKQVLITHWHTCLETNLIQLANAIDFASINNYVFVLNCHHMLINKFIVNFSDDPTITLLNIDDKYPTKLFYDNVEHIITQCRTSELLRDYVYHYFIQSSVNIDPGTLVIHGLQSLFSCYTDIIDKMGYTKILILTQPNLFTPVIDLLQEKYPTINIQTCSVIEECSTILQASHVVCGTFGYVLVLMSKNIKNLYLLGTNEPYNMESIVHFKVIKPRVL